MPPVEDYLRELSSIRSSGAGVKETSYYAALSNLLNEIGAGLKPKVRCILHPQNMGAGLPDGGLFTADQFQKQSAAEPAKGLPPARGVIEVKGAREDVDEIAASEQVTRYLARYRQVLVTNYRDFILMAQDRDGQPIRLEAYRIADSEAAFWAAAAKSRATAEQQGARLTEYLMRVMRHAATLADPADVAWFLASYARDARARIEIPGLSALEEVRAALEEALVMKFDGEKGERFFRSTLVQTLFYGIFSAWVLWRKKVKPTDRKTPFEWRLAAQYLRVPVLRKLFYLIAEPGELARLGVTETLDWAAAVLNRVDPSEFFSRFEEGEAVQYFYEPFLEAFDPELRRDLGVWYTPTEVVRYMVARVDTVLRKELGIADGLADPSVLVLDPCCGTGAYLVEVLRRIETTLREKGDDGLVGGDLKRAAMERVFGFELLPAPFVVAHLQLGLVLQNAEAPLSGDERAGVFLTNALTGWEPPKGPKQHLLFRELEQERDAAEQVKRQRKILVVIGNPPYNGFAGLAVEEERNLSDAYRTTVRAPAPQGQGLNDLYVRFFRMAERRIVEQSGRGIVCFISNYSWLDGLSFTGMRERYLDAFDRVSIDCLNGDKYKTGKLTPEGAPDPSVFSTERNREGIQVGTAIALLVRGEKHHPAGTVRFRHLWGKTKRAQLLEEAQGTDTEPAYEALDPPLAVGLPFLATEVGADYFKWPQLPELLPVSFPGVKTSRDDFVVDIDRERLVERMKAYFNPKIPDEEIRRINDGVMDRSSGFDGPKIRSQLLSRGFVGTNVVRYCYRPFDLRWLYWEPESKLLDRSRSDYFPQVFDENLWIEARQKQVMADFDRGFTIRVLGDNFGNGLSNYFPLLLNDEGNKSLFERAPGKKLNLTDAAIDFMKRNNVEAENLFYHVIATLHAPAYREENAGALRQDWPRVPLPANTPALLASAALGRKVAALEDLDQPVLAVTSGALRSELKAIGAITPMKGRALHPETGELDLTAGWGHSGKGGAVMPGKGKTVVRDYAADELATMEEGAKVCGRDLAEMLALLGDRTVDVYLNEHAFWRNVPLRVWEHTMGGYQVLKKWLSYRERDLLGRGLSIDEARLFTGIARRIATLRLFGPALDRSYEAVKIAAMPLSLPPVVSPEL